MRRLHGAASTSAAARLAIEMFCHSARKELAAMIAVFGGIDMIVFAGGIGENDAAIRAAICGDLWWAGISLDDARNRLGNNPLSDSSSRAPLQVLPSQEDEQIMRHAWALAQGNVF